MQSDNVKTTSILLTIALILAFSLPLANAGKSLVSDEHKINILNLFISDNYLECNKNLNAVIEFKNAGTENEYVHMELVNEKLGIDEFAPIVLVKPNGIASVTIPATLESEPKGEHEFEVFAYYSNEIKPYFKSFTFKGCQEPAKDDMQPDDAIIAQSGLEGRETAVKGLNLQTWYIILMVALIFVLVLVYLLKLYIQNITNRE